MKKETKTKTTKKQKEPKTKKLTLQNLKTELNATDVGFKRLRKCQNNLSVLAHELENRQAKFTLFTIDWERKYTRAWETVLKLSDPLEALEQSLQEKIDAIPGMEAYDNTLKNIHILRAQFDCLAEALGIVVTVDMVGNSIGKARITDTRIGGVVHSGTRQAQLLRYVAKLMRHARASAEKQLQIVDEYETSKSEKGNLSKLV